MIVFRFHRFCPVINEHDYVEVVLGTICLHVT